MRLPIALLVVTALAGCPSMRASKVVAIAGGGALIVGAVAAVIAGNTTDTTPSSDVPFGGPTTTAETTAVIMIPAGLILGIGGCIGMAFHASGDRR